MNTMIKITAIAAILVSGCTPTTKSEPSPAISSEPAKTEDMSMLSEPAEASVLVVVPVVQVSASATASAAPVSSAKK